MGIRSKLVGLKNRYLPERSYLYFQYPQTQGDRSLEFYLPMLENIEISESQRPNLATYDLIGRPGNLFAYLGSKSREYNLRFKITLPNVEEYFSCIGLNPQFVTSFRYFYSERDAALRRFTKRKEREAEAGVDNWDVTLKGESQNIFNYYRTGASQYGSNGPNVNAESFESNRFATQYEKYAQSISDQAAQENSKKLREFQNNTGWQLSPSPLFNSQNNKPSKTSAESVINMVMLWVNVIRSSTVGSNKNTSLGPPTIFINHGTMFRNIPCVCTNASIKLVENYGYDLLTMTPRQIDINMSLSENRTGNFGDYTPFKYIESENAAGWEALIDYGTFDKQYTTFGEATRDDFDIFNDVAAEKEKMAKQQALDKTGELYDKYGLDSKGSLNQNYTQIKQGYTGNTYQLGNNFA